MDQLLSELRLDPGSLAQGFTYVDFFISIILSTMLTLVVSTVYRITHTGLSYSRTFVLAMIIMAVTVSFIMMIIGSNLARAFSLVGALSIIRFRNPVKDSRDTAYIFLVMAIGMASGTKLYGMAIIFTVFTSLILLLLHRISFGSAVYNERLIQLTMPHDSDSTQFIDRELKELSNNNYSLLSSEILDDSKVLVYTVDIPDGIAVDNILDKFRSNYNGINVKLLTGFEKFNI